MRSLSPSLFLFKKHGSEKERAKEMERGTDSDRERGESELARDKGGHGSRGVTGGEPGGAREDERTPDSSIPKWMSLKNRLGSTPRTPREKKE